MKSRPSRNMAASVKQRLLNLARDRREDFNFLLTRYGGERFLYRLARSGYSRDFVLKGALLFHVAPVPVPHRPTKDVDLLGKGSADPARLSSLFRKIIQVVVPDDGLVFDPKSISAVRIQGEEQYEGIRVKLLALLGSARVTLQIDIGFGDAVTPAPRRETLETLLDLPAPRLLVYPWVTTVAEKLEAIVDLGMANCRMKDFFDLRHLSETTAFDGPLLARAIIATFKRRKTRLPESVPMGLTQEFGKDAIKQTQWAAFLRRIGQEPDRSPLVKILATLRRFLMSPMEAGVCKALFKKKWSPGGPWR